jgi:pimeloyl-ACP methyl ester carboxylesterase
VTLAVPPAALDPVLLGDYEQFGADLARRAEPPLARRAEPLLAPSSRMVVIDDAGHFLHLEKPAEVNEHILAWVTS